MKTRNLVLILAVSLVGILFAQRGPQGPSGRRVFLRGQQQLPQITVTGSPDATITLTIPGGLVDALETERLSPQSLGPEKCIDQKGGILPCAAGLTHIQEIKYPDLKSFILYLLTKPGSDLHRIQMAHPASGSQLQKAQRAADEVQAARKALEQKAVDGITIK